MSKGVGMMLSKIKTEIILDKFFSECFRYWKMQGKDEKDAFKCALNDALQLSHDPYVPTGDKIDAETKLKFIHYREMDLGR